MAADQKRVEHVRELAARFGNELDALVGQYCREGVPFELAANMLARHEFQCRTIAFRIEQDNLAREMANQAGHPDIVKVPAAVAGELKSNGLKVEFREK
jgi:hypothetical protein